MIQAFSTDKNRQHFFGDDPLSNAQLITHIQKLPSYLAQGQSMAVDPYPNKCNHCVQKKIKQRENMRASFSFLPKKLLNMFLPALPPIPNQSQQLQPTLACTSLGSPAGQSTPNPSRAQLYLDGFVKPMKTKAPRNKKPFFGRAKYKKTAKKKTKLKEKPTKEKPMFYFTRKSSFDRH